MIPQFRDYQQDAFDEIHESWAGGHNNVMAVMPTGAGKTVLSAGVVRVNNSATAVIAHRQELVGQLSIALARNEVKHRIIAPEKTIKLLVSLQIQETGGTFYDSRSPVAVAGVDTLIRRGAQLDSWFKSVGLWLIDECFPAGTQVSGRNIEDLRAGDVVEAFNEETGLLEDRKVVRLFKKSAPDNMVRIETRSHHVIICTPGHPIWTKRGWVKAGLLTYRDEVLINDLPRMQERISRDSRTAQEIHKNGSPLLWEDMLGALPGGESQPDHGRNEPEVRLGQDEEKQPHGQSGNPGESLEDSKSDRPQAFRKRGEWTALAPRGGGAPKATGRPGLLRSVRNQDENGQGLGFPHMLQDGRGKRELKAGGRSGREQPLLTITESAGREERKVLEWSRLDSVTLQKSANLGESPECSHDGFVYNIEVEGLHTYIANGVIVHNCHHIVRKNKWGKAVDMFPNARGLGVTATPLRADGHGLGAHADGVFTKMIIGPTMRDLINRGFLTDYRIFAPPTDIDLSKVEMSAATGDYNANGVRKAVHESHVVGDIVKEYLEHAAGKLGVAFAVDVESATQIAAKFNSSGVRAEVVSAKTPDVVRADILRRFRRRELTVLVNVDLFGEGFDLPAIEVIMMGRPTASYALFAQQFGRGLRILKGKQWAIIIDHVGNCLRHGLPDRQMDWSLDRREKRSNVNTPDDVIPVRSCPQCTGVYERIHAVCPYCQFYAAPVARSGPKEVDGNLLELDAETLAAMRGEALKVNQTDAEFIQGMKSRHVPDIGQNRQLRRFKEQQAAQTGLRGIMAVWNSYHASLGRQPDEVYKRFFWAFGADQLTASALPTREALALTNQMYTQVKKWK